MPNLGECFIASCHYESAPHPGNVHAEDIQFSTRVFIPEPLTRLISVQVIVTPKADTTDPLELNVEAALALSDFSDQLPDEELTQHAVMLGAPIAYGVIREHVANLTARSPFGLVKLPLISSRLLVSEAEVVQLDLDTPADKG